MITDIRVYSRQSMERLASEGRTSGFPFFGVTWHLVSIHGRSKQFLTPSVIKTLEGFGMSRSISLDFWDITDNPELIDALKKEKSDYILFSDSQAEDVVKFMNDRKAESSSDVLICHCDAGVSRSGAVGTFACEFFGLDYKKFCSDNPYVSPNLMVLRMLRTTAGTGGPTAFMTAFEAEAARKRKKSDEFAVKYAHLFV